MRTLLALSALGCLLCCGAALSLAQDAPATPAPSKETAAEPAPLSIDAEIARVWARDGITPAKPASDEEFLRRVYLDTVGAPPSYAEALAFLDDRAPDKRARLINDLLMDPRWGQHFGTQWALLLSNRDGNPLSGNQWFANWIAGELNNGTGFDKIMRRIVTAQGDLADNPAIVPYFADGQGIQLADLAGKLSRGLRGVQIQCAQCHDHHYDPALTQKVFEGYASWFAVTRAQVDNSMQPARAYVFEEPGAVKRVVDLYNKRMTLRAEQREQVEAYWRFIQPSTPDGARAEHKDAAAWRTQFADWLVSDDNKQTRRYVANRLWSFAFGSGIVNPVDDFTPVNSASHPELLDWLADLLRDSGWNLRALYRAMLNSRAYQLSSAGADKKAQPWHFAAYPVRQLSADQFIGALLNLMSDRQIADNVKQSRDAALDRFAAELARNKQAADEGKVEPNRPRYKYDLAAWEKFSKGFKAIPARTYITRFGAGRFAALSQDDEMNASEGFTGSIDQALLVLNGAFTNGLAANTPEGLLGRITREFAADRRIEAVYLHVLSRRPTEAEARRAGDFMAANGNKPQAAEDLLFALLMTTEFGTNH